MRIYVAARYDLRKEMLVVAARLVAAGHEVVSRWLSGKSGNARPKDNAAYQANDILRADALVIFTEDPRRKLPARTASARHTELGYALRGGKRIIVIGPRQNAFHHAAGVERYSSVDQMLRALAASGEHATPRGANDDDSA